LEWGFVDEVVWVGFLFSVDLELSDFESWLFNLEKKGL
jgi:hypothetical protein